MSNSEVISGSPYTRKWMRLATLNFIVVAAAGIALRYKLNYPFPQLDFKNLLHAHSHFAFAGWVSAALFTLLINEFADLSPERRKPYQILFWLNQITSYGMLFSFLIQEYGPVSIAFSTASIFVSYGYAYLLWSDSSKQQSSYSRNALRASLIFCVLSSFGPFALAYITATHIYNAELLHNAIYWYLHFQYNGWFSFAVFALFLRRGEKIDPAFSSRFILPLRLMTIACVPAYLLSVIWTAPSLIVYIIAGVAAILQMVAISLSSLQFIKRTIREQNRTISTLFLISFLSLTIKLLLQLLAVFPSINQFVFGHRPVIIGYLHLVMLGFVSFFVIAFAVRSELLRLSGIARTGIWFLIIGVLLNEAALMMQGLSGVLYTAFGWTPLMLFVASLVMFAGIATFGVHQYMEIRNASAVRK